MWYLKITTSSVVIESLVMTSKKATKYVDQIPDRPKICELQKRKQKEKHSYSYSSTSCVDFSSCNDHNYIFLIACHLICAYILMQK